MISAMRRAGLFVGLTVLMASLATGCSHGNGYTKNDRREDILSSNSTNPGNYSLFNSTKKLDRKIMKRGKKSRFTSSLDKGAR